MFKNKYYKQIILSDILEQNQKKIFFSRVLIVGLGGLGSISCIFLSSLGVSYLYILDDDTVEYSNLNRQIFFGFSDYRKKKIYLLKKYILSKNKDCKIFCYDLKINYFNFLKFSILFTAIVDGTDNIFSRKIINLLSLRSNSPYVYAALNNFEIILSVFNYNKNSCYECFEKLIFENNIVLNCNTVGVLNFIPSILALLQCFEVFKIIINHKNIIINKILFFDFLRMNLYFISLSKNKDCFCRDLNKIKKYKKIQKFFCQSIKETDFMMFLDELLYRVNFFNIFIIFLNYEEKKRKINFFYLDFEIKKNYNIDSKLILKFKLISKKFFLVFICNSGLNSLIICEFLRNNKINSFYLIGGFKNFFNFF